MIPVDGGRGVEIGRYSEYRSVQSKKVKQVSRTKHPADGSFPFDRIKETDESLDITVVITLIGYQRWGDKCRFVALRDKVMYISSGRLGIILQR